MFPSTLAAKMKAVTDYYDISVRISRMGEREEASEADQEAKSRERIEREGGAVGIVTIERNVSGGKAATSREVERLVQRIESGESAGICVYDFSRLTREDAFVASMLVGRIKLAGGRVLGAVDGYDSDAPGAAILTAAYAEQANAYLRTCRERSNAGRERAFEQGKYLTAVLPTGYDRAEDGSLCPNEQAHLVPELFALRIEGWSYRKLALWLREHGVEGATDGRVRSMLKNRAYLGEQSFGERVLTNQHPALVDEDSFNLVQSMFGKRTGNKSVDVLAKGLAKCGSCGKTMILVTNAKTRKRAFYCRGNSSAGCTNRAFIDAETLDQYLLDYVWAMSRKPDGPMADAVEAADRLDAAQALVMQKQARLDALLNDTTIDVADMLIAAKAQREALELAKQDLAQAKADASTLGDLLTLFATDRPSTDQAERRRLLTTVLDEVRVMAVGREQIDVSERTQIIWSGGVTYSAEPEKPLIVSLF